MKTIATCENSFQAELICGRLKDVGIPAIVIHDTLEQVMPYSFANPGMKPQVVVSDSDYETAVELFKGTEEKLFQCCPACGSEEIGYGMKGGSWRQKIAWISAVFITLISLSPLGKIQNAHYCKKCKARF